MVISALRNCNSLEQRSEKLERLIERWILDPSSFIDPEGDKKGILIKKGFEILIFINQISIYTFIVLRR